LLSRGLFWQSSNVTRLLVFIVIIGVLIWLGWTKPLNERYAEVKTTITAELNDLGKKTQKNHESSDKRK